MSKNHSQSQLIDYFYDLKMLAEQEPNQQNIFITGLNDELCSFLYGGIYEFCNNDANIVTFPEVYSNLQKNFISIPVDQLSLHVKRKILVHLGDSLSLYLNSVCLPSILLNLRSSSSSSKENVVDNNEVMTLPLLSPFTKQTKLLLTPGTQESPDVKQFKCEKCNREFKRKVHLMRHQIIHQRQHQSPPNVKCKEPSCHMLFTTAKSISLHMKKFHRPPNEVKCLEQSCHRLFKTVESRRQHMRKFHMRKFYRPHNEVKCLEPSCYGLFKTVKSMRQHMKSAHSMQTFFSRLECVHNEGNH